MAILDVFLIVATVALIVNVVLIVVIGIGIWKLVITTTGLVSTADSGLTTIKHKILDPDASDDMQTARMLTQGVMGISRVVFGDKKKKKHTK